MNDFLGRSINGKISHYADPPVKQDDPTLFIEALEALLSEEVVDQVRWEQYTPYF